MTNLCNNCPDHEACMTGWTCEVVKRYTPPAPPAWTDEVIVPPVFKYETHRSLDSFNPLDLRILECDGWCRYGDCGWRQCGGCCGCLGGCQVAHENQQIAPFLWEGDYA
jgi:hypothetical protein